MLYVVSQPPAKRAALILPIEGNRWLVHAASACMAIIRRPILPGTWRSRRACRCRTCTKRCARRAAHRSRALRLSGRAAPSLREAEPISAGAARARRRVVQLQSDLWAGHERRIDVRRRAAGVPAGTRRARLESQGLWRRSSAKPARCRRHPWQLATGEDFRYTETTGPRGRALKLLHWYTARCTRRRACRRWSPSASMRSCTC